MVTAQPVSTEAPPTCCSNRLFDSDSQSEESWLKRERGLRVRGANTVCLR